MRFHPNLSQNAEQILPLVAKVSEIKFTKKPIQKLGFFCHLIHGANQVELFKNTLILFYKQHIIKKTSWTVACETE